MKRQALASVALTLVLLFTGCQAQNTLAPKPLSKDAEEILEILSLEQELAVFTIRYNQPYHKISVWAELYQNGGLVQGEPDNLFFSADPTNESRLDGTLAISLAGQQRNQLTVMLCSDEVTTSYSTELPALAGNMNAHSFTQESVALQAGQEVLLYSNVYSNGDTLAAYSAQELLTDPTLLKAYSKALLIKCRID